MICRICHHESLGLANDAVVLCDAIQRFHNDIQVHVYPEMELFHSKANQCLEMAHVQIFLEHIHPDLVDSSRYNIYIPNLEFMSRTDVHHIRHVHMVVAKTHQAFSVLKQMFPTLHISHWGWTSRDRLIEGSSTTRDGYLHVKGVSRFKNSQALLNTWLKHPEWPELHVVCHGNIGNNGYMELNVPFVQIAPNIKLTQRRMSDEELTNLMNAYNKHICCSVQEGFGHYINEAKSCQAAIVSTDGEPMNELIQDDINGVLVHTQRSTRVGLGTCYDMSEEELTRAIERMHHLDSQRITEMGVRNRHEYMEAQQAFIQNVCTDLESKFL